MTYDPNIPQPADLISVSQVDILRNFQQLNIVYGADHYAYNDATADAQKHRQVRLVEQAADVPAVALQGNIYVKDNPSATVTRADPYYRYEAGGLGNSQIAPLIPFKAMASFVANGPNGVIAPANIFQAYNIASITKATPTALSATYTVVFTNLLDDNVAGTPMEYIVFCSGTSVAANFNRTFSYANTLNSGVTLIAMSKDLGIPTRFSFGVIQY